jgi:hypothetical protein
MGSGWPATSSAGRPSWSAIGVGSIGIRTTAIASTGTGSTGVGTAAVGSTDVGSTGCAATRGPSDDAGAPVRVATVTDAV